MAFRVQALLLRAQPQEVCMGSEMIAKAIAAQEWLDPISDGLQEAVHAALDDAGQLKDLLHGVWLGHPLHPALTDIPVGAWTVALMLDAIGGVTGNDKFAGAADAAIAVGLLGAAGSAVTGLADWSETDGPARRVGVVHAILNVVATGVYTASFILRKGRRREGIALSMIGYAIASGSAYLGGHLVFGEQIGVDHTATADASQPEKFVAVLDVDDLENDTPTRAMADGVAILLVKHGGRIHALTETCPHLGGPLSEGKLVGDAIQCPWHKSELALKDGRVVRGPTTYPARCFDVRVRNGKIEVRSATRR
jgi:nitrite reductase/ring-hydroxylating ferredoxin subunit/uncharacterized membrane protein